MKNLSFKFVFITLVIFTLLSFIIYSIDITFLQVPLFATIFTLFYCEKKEKHRIFYILLSLLIGSQFATPLPLLFLIFISVQVYLLTVSFFSSTAFDFSLTALINSILATIIIFINRLAYLYVFTGDFHFFSSVLRAVISSILLILAYNVFKRFIDSLFVKDSWL